MTEQSFEATYAQMSDGELARALRDRRDLVPEAVKALDLEVQKRHLDQSQLKRLRPHSIDKLRRPTIVERRLKGKRIRGIWLIAFMVLSLVLIAILDHFGIDQLYWPIITTVAVPAFTVWGHLELRGRLWFWIAIGLVTTTHVALFYSVGWPWGTKWVPARAIAGLWSLDLLTVFALISLIEKLLDHHQSENAGSHTR